MPRSTVRTERTPVTLSDFEAELIKLDSASTSTNLMVYGDSNAGKTWLAGTAPGRTFWLIGEPGYKAAARQGATGDGVHITDTAVAWAAVQWLRAKRHYKRFDWMILDGLTTMQDRIRISYANEAFDLNPAKRAHRNLPDRPDYFNTQNFLKAWIAALTDLPVNLLITAHAYRTDKTENGELLVFPGIQGKVTETANAIAGLMDVVGYYEARNVKNRKTGKVHVRRRLHLSQPTNTDELRYIVGDKFDALGSYMDNPTIPAMLEKIGA